MGNGILQTGIRSVHPSVLPFLGPVGILCLLLTVVDAHASEIVVASYEGVINPVAADQIGRRDLSDFVDGNTTGHCHNGYGDTRHCRNGDPRNGQFPLTRREGMIGARWPSRI